MSRSTLAYRAILALGALTIPLSFYINRLRSEHDRLSHQVVHFADSGENEMLTRYGSDVVSLPKGIASSQSKNIVLYDEAIKAIKASALPDWNVEQLLTAYMQHNMIKFAELPQGWLLWMVEDQPGKQTFNEDYLSALNFEKGDRACGGYIVQHRDPGKVEMGLTMGKPGTKNYIEGRLAISIEIDKESNTAICRTRTYMWRGKDGAYMPLERSIPKFLHELASWGLIDQGIRHLTQLRGEQTS